MRSIKDQDVETIRCALADAAEFLSERVLLPEQHDLSEFQVEQARRRMKRYDELARKLDAR